MSYTFLLEQGEESLAESFSDIPASVLLNLIPMQEKCCLQDKGITFSQNSQFGMTSKHLMEPHGGERLTSFAEDSRARTSVQQERELESMDQEVVFGNTWRELLMKFDQPTSLLKTHRCLWDEVLPLSSVILPQWGMTQNGEFWERQTLAHITCAKDAGFWPTPLKEEGPGSQQMKLTDAVAVAEGYKPRYHLMDGTEGRKAFTGKVNPEWVEWLMGWPMGWTNDLQELAMDRFQLWLHQHGKSCPENEKRMFP